MVIIMPPEYASTARECLKRNLTRHSPGKKPDFAPSHSNELAIYMPSPSPRQPISIEVLLCSNHVAERTQMMNYHHTGAHSPETISNYISRHE